MKNPKVSIIVVTFNAEATIKAVIRSVAQQTYPNTELIIIDGKSTDNTVSIIKEFNVVTSWISEPDAGIYDAMNKGITLAQGEWIVFLGADDIFYDSNSIKSIFSDEINYKNFDFVYGNVWLKKSKRVMGGSRNLCSLVENNIPHQAIFFNKRIFDIVGFFNQNYPVLGDYDFNIRVFSNPRIKSNYVDKILGIFDQSGVSSRIIDGKFFKDYKEFSQKVAADFNKPIVAKKYLFFTGVKYILDCKFRLGLTYLRKAYKCKGKNLFYFLLLAYILIRVILFGRNSVYK